MKKIYCKKCGYKVFDSDAEYCPRCGARINDFHEVQNIEKNRKTRNIILIALILICITIAGVFSYAMFFNEQYQTVQVSQSASLEMPVGKGLQSEYVNGTSIYQVDNGKGVMIMSFNSNNNDLASAFGFAVVKEIAVGSRFNDDSVYQTTVNGSTVWSIATSNNSTHDNIIISSHDKDLTLRIYNSIKYGNNSNNTNSTGNDTNNVNSNNNSKHIYGYADDGTPFYSQAELEKYIMDKGGYASYEDYLKTQNAPDGVAYYDGQPYYIDGDRYVDGSGAGRASSSESSSGGGSSDSGSSPGSGGTY